jgi:hypothetical protein
MDKIMQLIESLFSLTTEQQIFVIASLAISVAGLALYVVLTALKKVASTKGNE